MTGARNSMKKIWTSLVLILLVAWNVYLTTEIANLYTEIKELYIHLLTEINTREQNESAIEKDLRLLKTDTDILMRGYEEE